MDDSMRQLHVRMPVEKIMSTQLLVEMQVQPPNAPTAALVCPACGGANDTNAVFCAHAACGKALGPFDYVREELAAETRWYVRLADRATAFISRPHFLVAHSLWFLLWLALNTGVLAFVGKFDDYPYNLLGLILSVESIFITGFLLISQSRQHAHADKRAELDYEVSVRTYREIEELKELVLAMQAQLAQVEISRRKN
jgi:low affinity Fe/Cu permease